MKFFAEQFELNLDNQSQTSYPKNMNNKTNIQKVTEFMEKSPIHQAMVIQAVSNMTSEIVKTEKEVRKMMVNSFVIADCWIGAAKDWKE